jgi:hypothetical protein
LGEISTEETDEDLRVDEHCTRCPHSDCYNKIPFTELLEQQTFASHIVEGGKSKIKVLADSVLGEGSASS